MFVFKKIKSKLFFVVMFEDVQNRVAFFILELKQTKHKKTFHAETIQSQSLISFRNYLPVSFRNYLPASDQEFLWSGSSGLNPAQSEVLMMWMPVLFSAGFSGQLTVFWQTRDVSSLQCKAGMS